MSSGLAGLLPVPNFQSLASTYSGHVPVRYLRPELLCDEVLVDESLQIPTIDVGKVMADDDDEMAKLHLACREWGFFQLINHGVAEEIIENMKADIQQFFKLPLEDKNAYRKTSSGHEGYGQQFVVSEDQQLDWADMFGLQTLPASTRTMRFWPEQLTSFRESLDKSSLELQEVSNCLLKLIVKNLGTDPAQHNNMFRDGRQTVKINYYPPCVQANKVIGLTPHSDFSVLTLLLQVSEVPGLQIKKNDQWIQVRPLPGAFIVNIGDVMEIMSNGEYKSVEHRAMVNTERERLSIATFYALGDETIIGPLPELTKRHGAIYKSVGKEEFLKLAMGRKLDGKNLIKQMKLKN